MNPRRRLFNAPQGLKSVREKSLRRFVGLLAGGSSSLQAAESDAYCRSGFSHGPLGNRCSKLSMSSHSDPRAHGQKGPLAGRVKCLRENSAEAISRGLKPTRRRGNKVVVAARLKPCPFKATLERVFPKAPNSCPDTWCPFPSCFAASAEIVPFRKPIQQPVLVRHCMVQHLG